MAGLELSGWPPLLGMLAFVRDLVLTLLAVLVVAVVVKEGPAGLARRLLSAAKLLPGAEWMIAAALRREVRGFVRQVQKEERRRSDHKEGKTLAIPQKGGWVGLEFIADTSLKKKTPDFGVYNC